MEKIKGMVSVVIPLYEQYEFIDFAIDSVAVQSYKNLEIIVVDDCSPQRKLWQYRSMVDWLKMAEHITYIDHATNCGLSQTRNTGIATARGEWILPLDADDRIHWDMIRKCMETAEQDKADIVSTWLETFGAYVKVSKPFNHPSYNDLLVSNRINCCSLFKKEVWEKVGGYDTSMKLGYEDYMFWLDATKAGYKISVVQEILFYYRKHKGLSMLDGAKLNRDSIYSHLNTRHKLR